MSAKATFFMGNESLAGPGYVHSYTPDQIVEYAKCVRNPIYFAENYIKIVHPDTGTIPFKLYDFQKTMMESFHANRFSIVMTSRQVGKSTTVMGYFLHQILFNQNLVVAIAAHKEAIAKQTLANLKLAYENLPLWLQQGVLEWNVKSIKLANGSKAFAAATASASVRGGSYARLLLDEFAFVRPSIAEQFVSSTFPTISSGKKTKIIMVSTPNGMNMFYKFWNDAQQKRNDFNPIFVHWRAVPGRDDEWKRDTIRMLGSEAIFDQEYECSFLSAQDTLIDGITLARLTYEEPLATINHMRMFEKPIKDHIYVMTIDTGLGVGQNNSAFSITDVTQTPYKVVASYSDNKTVPTLFAEHCMAAAKLYNNAYTLIEITDIGQEVVSIFRYEYEYEHIITVLNRPRQGQQVTGGFGKQTSWGVKTTTAVKKIGCATVKTLLEGNQLLIPDFETIKEFTTFVRRKASYEAAEGMTDDSVMTLVLFGWLTTQQYFIQLTDINIRAKFLQEEQDKNSQDFIPFGIVNDGETVSAPVMPGETSSAVNEDDWMNI